MKEKFLNNILPLSSLLKDVLRTLDRSPVGIVFFIDEVQKVQGIMTDGDVRRAVLSGADLDDPIEPFLVKDFVYGQADLPRSSNAKLLNEVIRHLPILDQNGRLVDFISITDFLRLPVAEPSLTGNELAYVIDCIETNWISSQGSYVREFEKIFARYHEVEFALTTSSGTTALHLALKALGIGPGDEVIVPDLTFGASANTVVHCGATPVFIDVDPTYWNLDPGLLEKVITPRTKAVMPVHLYGHPCDMDPILEIAEKNGLFVVEDCAEALGAEYKGKLVGTFGHVGCFSFFSNKVITTGEGGMVITNDSALFERMELLRDHGMRKEKRYWHDVPGFNYRMTNLQAAIGLAQMEQVEKFITKRRNLAQAYSKELAGIPGITLAPEKPWAKSIFWLYSILVDERKSGVLRDKLLGELEKEGIETRAFFSPLHIQPPFPDVDATFPVSEKLAACGLSLPCSNNLSKKDVQRVCQAVRKIVKNSLQLKQNLPIS